MFDIPSSLLSEERSDRTLNLLIITSTLYLGGVQKVTCILANALAENNNVTVAYCYDSGRRNPFSEKCRIHKLPEYDGAAGRLAKASGLRRQIKALKALKRELKTDAAISLGNVGNIINAMSGGPCPVICCERNNPKKALGRLFFLLQLSYRKADHIVFQSEKVRGFFPSHIREKSSILKNPVLIPIPAADHREKKIVSIGRLDAQKNQWLLIRSFARFHERFPEYRLHLFGEGGMEGQLRTLAADLGVLEQVILEGDDPNVHARIRDAEMFVLSSDYEGLSNALLECMSMGIACISTRCEGSVDVIQEGENGLLVDVGDERSLTQAMCRLAADPQLRERIALKAREDMKGYASSAVTKDWENMIRKCCGCDAAAESGDL